MGCGYRNGSPYIYRESTALIKDSTWPHLVCEHATGSTNITIYLDGALDSTTGTSSSGSPGDPGTSTSTLHVGRFGDVASNYYTGDLDGSRVMKFAMTADQAKCDYINQNNHAGTYTVTTP